jgi:hypothetical protein
MIPCDRERPLHPEVDRCFSPERQRGVRGPKLNFIFWPVTGGIDTLEASVADTVAPSCPIPISLLMTTEGVAIPAGWRKVSILRHRGVYTLSGTYLSTDRRFSTMVGRPNKLSA